MAFTNTKQKIFSLYPNESELWDQIVAIHHPEKTNRPRKGESDTFRELIYAEAKRLGLIEEKTDE